MKKVEIHKVLWMFLVGGTVGCFLEMIWCFFDFGVISSRSSNFFFPFSIVWAVGSAVLCVILKESDADHPGLLFLKGYVLGGCYEFLCGMTAQKILGVTFWDYSARRFSLGRYVNLLFCCFWGILAIVWVKWLYPFCDRVMEKNPKKRVVTLAWIGFVFILTTQIFTGAALLRMERRSQNESPHTRFERMLDTYYDDEMISALFPKMKPVHR